MSQYSLNSSSKSSRSLLAFARRFRRLTAAAHPSRTHTSAQTSPDSVIKLKLYLAFRFPFPFSLPFPLIVIDNDDVAIISGIPKIASGSRQSGTRSAGSSTYVPMSGAPLRVTWTLFAGRRARGGAARFALMLFAMSGSGSARGAKGSESVEG